MTRGSRPRAIVLSGPVGSGKTTLLLEIGEVLEGLGERYALVDLDWLAWLKPAPGSALTVNDVLVRNLGAVWETFLRAGVERLVLARLVERREQLAAIRRALPDVDLFAIRLAVPLEVLEQRLRRRDTGRELAEHLAFAARAETTTFEDAAIANGADRQPREVALEILTAAGWLADIDSAERSPTAV